MPATDMGDRLAPNSGTSIDRGSSSAPQSRSNSWKSKHRSSSRKDKRMSHSARTNSVSMPDCSDTDSFRKMSTSSKECPFCMVRSFKTTSKGIVDSGSFSKSLSTNSLLSAGSLNTSHGSSGCSTESRRASVDRARTGSLASSDSSEGTPSICVTPSYFRTLVLGAPGVGKSSLVQQLTRPDSQNEDDEQWTSESGPIVSVELDGQESSMEFIDGADMSDLECYRADSYVLMYSVSEPESFTLAANLLNHLRHDLGTDRTIYLAANKTDLVRQRLVSSHEAKQYASRNDCHFIEISTSLNVNLDELLLGILCSIKRQLMPVQDVPNQENTNRCKPSSSDLRSPRSSRSTNSALSAISNFLKHACRREHRTRDVTPVRQLV